MEVVTFVTHLKVGVCQLEKIKWKWKELEKIPGEWGDVRAVKRKSENKGENNARIDGCLPVDTASGISQPGV